MRRLRALIWAPIALLLFFEEWGWRPLARAMGRSARWTPVARLETWLRGVSPALALALFVMPAALLLPIKLLALWLIHQGHAVGGLVVIVVAKLVGTALLGRLFVLTEAPLRRYARLARALDAWTGYKSRVKAWVSASAAWRSAMLALAGLRKRWRRAMNGGGS